MTDVVEFVPPPPTEWLPQHVQDAARLIMRAWCQTPGPHWHEDAAVLVCSFGDVRRGLAALPVLDQLRARHQPIRLAADSDVVVCSCTGRIAYAACPDAALLHPTPQED